MGSRARNPTPPYHQPLRSLVVRPSSNDGGDGDGGGGGRTSRGVYETGEVRHDPPSYSRSDRYSNDPGYRIHKRSASPAQQRGRNHHHSSNFDNPGGPPRSLEYVGRRDPGRFRDPSPPYMRFRGGGRPSGRGLEGPFFGPGSFRVEGMSRKRSSVRGLEGPGFGSGPFRGEGVRRNNPNVRQRDGDWICPDPLCNNLNFARREYCNSCKRFRYPPGGSPPRGYPHRTLPLSPPRRFAGPPTDFFPGKTIGNRSPPRNLPRDGSRDFGLGGLPPPRHEARFSDLGMRRDRLNHPEDDFRGRKRFDRPMEVDWGHKDYGREIYNERRGFERRPLSPPPMPVQPLSPPLPPPIPRGQWAHGMRERSRSPVRGAPPLKEYRRDMYIKRGHDNLSGVQPDRIGDAY